MKRKIENKIKKLEEYKEVKINKKEEIQKEIEDVELKLKKLNVLKKEFEKIENNTINYLETLKT